MINVDVSVKNITCENGKYLTSIIEDSVIRCDETIEETIAVPTNFNEKTNKSRKKKKKLYLYLY